RRRPSLRTACRAPPTPRTPRATTPPTEVARPLLTIHPMNNSPKLPLQGIRVIDFSTLLPGPLCRLLLARAGPEVIKIERPGRGDEMRSYEPKFGTDSVNFVLLNQGKRSVALDLKDAAGREKALELVRDADVLLEQFRPGVMDRLGLGWEQVR